ncbi:hypothetical protein BKA70DRAFT_1421392 [Coprinopsis sp. MPI-PUGE-AT-0042]|nr:hypothetical protein BKA70DRAFT_1421392 [Coprinopsis sp. MPI-PUGE-AT-0042]
MYSPTATTSSSYLLRTLEVTRITEIELEFDKVETDLGVKKTALHIQEDALRKKKLATAKMINIHYPAKLPDNAQKRRCHSALLRVSHLHSFILSPLHTSSAFYALLMEAPTALTLPGLLYQQLEVVRLARSRLALEKEGRINAKRDLQELEKSVMEKRLKAINTLKASQKSVQQRQEASQEAIRGLSELEETTRLSAIGMKKASEDFYEAVAGLKAQGFSLDTGEFEALVLVLSSEVVGHTSNTDIESMKEMVAGWKCRGRQLGQEYDILDKDIQRLEEQVAEESWVMRWDEEWNNMDKAQARQLLEVVSENGFELGPLIPVEVSPQSLLDHHYAALEQMIEANLDALSTAVSSVN